MIDAQLRKFSVIKIEYWGFEIWEVRCWSTTLKLHCSKHFTWSSFVSINARWRKNLEKKKSYFEKISFPLRVM
jgi:hypothetical protein